MCDLYPFERQADENLPRDIKPFRNYVRGPQSQLSQKFVTFRFDWHFGIDYIFSVMQHLTVWNVTQYWTAIEPDKYFEAFDEYGAALNAAVLLPRNCHIQRTSRTSHHPDAFRPEFSRFMSRDSQTEIGMHQRRLHSESVTQQTSKPPPPKPPQVAGCMSLYLDVYKKRLN